MATTNFSEAELIADAEHREAALETESLPQDGYRGPVRVVLQKSGPAFVTVPPVSVNPTQGALTAVGEVLNAIEHKCVPDLVEAWTRLSQELRLDIVRLPAVSVGFWGSDPWGRLSSTVIQALCHASNPTAAVKWANADVAICAWVRHRRDSLAKELHSETDLSDYAISEDGPTDPARVAVLEAQIDTLTRFLAGLTR